MTERELFLALLDVEPAQRPTYLDTACGSDRALRQHLERLLKAHAETQGFLEKPAYDLDGAATAVQENLRRLAEPDCWIGPYQLLEQVGAGGMGVIYKAYHPETKRLVALKMILAGAHALAQDLARFRVEAEAVGELRHPHIVEIYEVGTHEGLPYLAMEFMDKGNLTQALGGAPLPPHHAAALVEILARAIHAMHQLGIVHRDLKPANVLLGTPPPAAAAPAVVQLLGVPKITDFGLAKRLDEEFGNTRSGAVMGTPSYMAPEQAEGQSRHVGPAADVYALGAILYEVLTGRPPFQGATMMAILDQVRSQEPVSPSKIEPNLPRDVVTICLRTLAKEPHNRYASAEALADDLRHFLSAERVCARPVTRRERTWRWCRRNPLLAGMIAGVSVLLLVLLLALWVGHLLRQSRDSALDAQRRAEESDAKIRDALGQLEQAQREVKARGCLARAAALRTRGQVGQRFACLAELRQALQLEPSAELRAEIRTEAIAALALPDLEIARAWEGYPAGSAALAFDGSLERYVRVDQQGNAVVCRLTAAGEEVRARLPALPKLRLIGHPLLSRSGRWLLIWQGPQFRVWDLDQAEPKLMLQHEASYVQWSVALHPDAPHLAVGHNDHTVSVWNLETGQRRRQLKLKALPGPLAFNPKPGDPRLAVVCGGVVHLFDVASGAEYPPLRLAPAVTGIEGLAWHPDGRRLAIGGDDLRIHLWDADTAAAVMPPWVGHKTAPIFPVFNRAGDRLLSNDWSGQPRLWDTATGRLLFTGSELASISQPFSRDGSLLGYGRTGSKLRLYRVATGQELRVLRRPQAAPDEILTGPVLDGDGEILAATAPGWLSFFQLATGEELASVRLRPGVRAHPWGFQRGSGWLTGECDQIRLWPARRDSAAPGVVRVGPPQLLTPARFEHAAASADSRVVAVADGNAGAFVLPRDPPGRRLTLGPQYDVRRVAVSPAGRWVVTCSHWPDLQSRNVRIWDAATGRHVHDLPLDALSAASFSPDGQWLASGTGGMGCKLWEVETWRLVRDFSGVGFAFSPDSRLLALSDQFASIRLVEVTSGREVARLTFPEAGWYHPACFSPDGAHLVATHGDLKAVYVWDLRRVRQGLQTLGLDWDAPPYPAPSPAFARPLRVVVEDGVMP